MKHSRRVKGFGALLLITGLACVAAEKEDEMVSENFLLFLGEWEDEQGSWQDPSEYEDPAFQALDKKDGKHDH